MGNQADPPRGVGPPAREVSSPDRPLPPRGQEPRRSRALTPLAGWHAQRPALARATASEIPARTPGHHHLERYVRGSVPGRCEFDPAADPARIDAPGRVRPRRNTNPFHVRIDTGTGSLENHAD